MAVFPVLVLIDGVTLDAWGALLPVGLFAIAARGAVRAWWDSREPDRYTTRA